MACGLASDSGDMRITFNMLACCVIDVACMVFDDEAFMCDRWQRPAGPWMESFKCMQRTQLSATNHAWKELIVWQPSADEACEHDHMLYD